MSSRQLSVVPDAMRAQARNATLLALQLSCTLVPGIYVVFLTQLG